MSSSKSMSIQKVAVVGPSGTLGPAVVKHLPASRFEVTLLTRDPTKLPATKFPADIKVVRADCTSVETLVPFFLGHDAVVDLTNRTATEIQLCVIDAAIAAQISRLIPSCYGIGTRDPLVRTFPHAAGKAEMEDYVIQKAKEGALTFTGIQTGVFLELALENGRFINTKDNEPTMLFDGGDVRISMTSVDTIGMAVAAVLKKPEETRNRFLSIQSTVVTQNKLLQFARELAPQRAWKGMFKDTAEMERASREAWQRGDRSPLTNAGFFVRLSFGEGLGYFENVDNSLLGIDSTGDEELKGILARFI